MSVVNLVVETDLIDQIIRDARKWTGVKSIELTVNGIGLPSSPTSNIPSNRVPSNRVPFKDGPFKDGGYMHPMHDWIYRLREEQPIEEARDIFIGNMKRTRKQFDNTLYSAKKKGYLVRTDSNIIKKTELGKKFT